MTPCGSIFRSCAVYQRTKKPDMYQFILYSKAVQPCNTKVEINKCKFCHTYISLSFGINIRTARQQTIAIHHHYDLHKGALFFIVNILKETNLASYQIINSFTTAFAFLHLVTLTIKDGSLPSQESKLLRNKKLPL